MNYGEASRALEKRLFEHIADEIAEFNAEHGVSVSDVTVKFEEVTKLSDEYRIFQITGVELGHY